MCPLQAWADRTSSVVVVHMRDGTVNRIESASPTGIEYHVQFSGRPDKGHYTALIKADDRAGSPAGRGNTPPPAEERRPVRL